jgi:Holliday junction DNA helicase RuvA
MIGRLSGRIVEDGEGGVLVVDVNGVGYEVIAPLGTRGRLTADPLGNVTLYIHTHVREEALQLFGFGSTDEREAFRVLIGISNVGPKMAIGVLSAVSVNELAQAVGRGEVGKLTTIPGVGKKTAERLVLELKGKLAVSAGGRPLEAPVPVGSKAETVVSALTRMGFRPNEAERVVATLAQGPNFADAPLGDLVRDALGMLSR